MKTKPTLLELLRNMQIQFAQGQGGEGGESEMAQALREGNLGVMDYFNLQNIGSDTQMRNAIAGGEKDNVPNEKEQQ